MVLEGLPVGPNIDSIPVAIHRGTIDLQRKGSAIEGDLAANGATEIGSQRHLQSVRNDTQLPNMALAHVSMNHRFLSLHFSLYNKFLRYSC